VTPYYADEHVTLYHGDCREIMPTLGPVDCIVADPPYGETSLPWDRWPDGWVAAATEVTRSMWCFGSMRMFLTRYEEFAPLWKLSQDVVWEKPDGTGLAADRFRRVHEHALHWYWGSWSDLHHDTPKDGTRKTARTHVRRTKPTHQSSAPSALYVDDGSRLLRSVIGSANLHGRSLHPTEKPLGILDPLIRYACPPGGTVLDPFAGSGSTAEAARQSGRRAVLIEADERYCELIVRRMAQGVLIDASEVPLMPTDPNVGVPDAPVV
jgi:site-specific DNA-methyltransferase (adenine-specific)